ncbi:hypothetical protein [Streptomyces sp. CBMA123]|uniref:hypothetical protein n=1 Tax=Streptomyces sp. CBMA123 TaxID=1896313 RepID=UPI001661BB73|nr:hypothetical protein [Streptomyces sp. CBMA123]MBD0691582.1 hypothetical protein [Streptomyces sp. CBMA123]
MFDRLELVLPQPDDRWPLVRFLVNGEDVIEGSVGSDGRGRSPFAQFPVAGASELRATGEPRRVNLGEPECDGGCCGYLSAVVQRIGEVVLWSDWELPDGATRPMEYTFEAAAYEAELARAEADPWWRPEARTAGP